MFSFYVAITIRMPDFVTVEEFLDVFRQNQIIFKLFESFIATIKSCEKGPI